MPYIRKTPRKPGRHFVTLDRLTEANWQVTVEMERLGLWCDELYEIDVWLVPVSFACYGWFRMKGDIYIPAVSGPIYAISSPAITRASPTSCAMSGRMRWPTAGRSWSIADASSAHFAATTIRATPCRVTTRITTWPTNLSVARCHLRFLRGLNCGQGGTRGSWQCCP